MQERDNLFRRQMGRRQFIRKTLEIGGGLGLSAVVGCDENNDQQKAESAGHIDLRPENVLSEPSPTQTPASAEALIQNGRKIAIEDGIAIRTGPTTDSEKLRDFNFGDEVRIKNIVPGEMWMNKGQNITPLNHFPDWIDKWYELEDGNHVYSAFVFVPRSGETSPLITGQKKRVEVDRKNQRLYAFADTNKVFEAMVGVGLSDTQTPLGEYRAEPQGRVFNEIMQSSDPQDPYRVEKVLFTQYFKSGGYALHLDWWHDESYFGKKPTSHGCVGLQLHDAQWMWIFGRQGMEVNIYE